MSYTVQYFDHPHGTCHMHDCKKPANRIYSYNYGNAWFTFCEDHSVEDYNEISAKALSAIEFKLMFGEEENTNKPEK